MMTRLLTLSLFLSAGFVTIANAMVIVNEDFESYANQAGVDAAWPNSSGTQPVWSTVQSASPTHSLLEPTGSPGRVTSATTDTTNSWNGTASSPLELSYEIYINPSDLTSSRRYVELREEDGGIDNIFVIGLTNLSGLDNTKFGIRNSFVWTQLNAPRVAGWNSVKTLITDTQFQITINGGTTETFARSVGTGYGRLYLGSGFSNNTAAPNAGLTFIDNVLLQNVPEPSATWLLALGMGVLFRRR